MEISDDKIYNMLGLCKNARKLLSGEMMCEKSIKEGNAQLVIIANDAADNSKKKFYALCKNHKIDLVVFGVKLRLGHCIGESERSAISITDRSFKNLILDIIKKKELNMGVSNECPK